MGQYCTRGRSDPNLNEAVRKADDQAFKFLELPATHRSDGLFSGTISSQLKTSAILEGSRSDRLQVHGKRPRVLVNALQ